MTEVILTEEQKAFLAECEEEFADRFTDKDEDFMKIKAADAKNPPIVDPWYNKPRRNFDWSRQNQGQGGRRNQNWDRRGNERNDRMDRHAGKHHNYHRSRPY